jgi:glycosyltransferase involved in cell wall biosynthesis
MDLLVLTSKSEGTPLNIIEAQIAGVAVLAPQIGGINDMVVDGKTSVLYDKSGEIVPKLLELIDDRTALSEMGNEAAKFATEKYSLDIMLSEYEKLYS